MVDTHQALTRRLTCCVAAFAVVCAMAAPAFTQTLSRVNPVSGSSTILNLQGAAGVTRGTDIAWDPVHSVYLVVQGYGPVTAQFVDVSGNPASGVLTIMDGAYFGHYPRALYSQDLNGGQGGFLITWHENSAGAASNEVHTVVVSYPTGVISPDRSVSDPAAGLTFWEAPASIAYSPTSRKFLVVWQTISPAYGIQGRFVDLTGAAMGSVMEIESPGSSRNPAVAWSPLTDNFGVIYCAWSSSNAFAAFKTVRASDGAISGRTSFGFSAGTYFADAAYNEYSNKFVMTWALQTGVNSAAFDASGTYLGSGLVSTYLLSTTNMGLALNPISHTFLIVGHGPGYDDVGVELNANGAPNSVATKLTGGATQGGSGGSYYPRAAANTVLPQWGMSFSLDQRMAASQIVGTISINGGSAAPIGSDPSTGSSGGGTGGGGSTGGGGTTTGCTGPDPFTAIGGGTCVNGGWIPKTAAGGSAGGTTGGCTTADPFAAIGGGVCVNGGWVPNTVGGGSTGGTTTGGCTTADPFAAIGGGVCVNGGWVPKTATGGSTGGSTTGGCTTADPFAAIGGGVCVNGGWVPKTATGGSTGGGTTGGCTTADPFTAIGGGVCLNGGWVPKTATGGSTGGSTNGCTGSDPFAAMGGGVCVNGGWVPNTAVGGSTGGTTTTGCAGSDPFAAIGGGVCVNGGWIPRSATTSTPSSTCTIPDPFTAIGGGVCVNGGWIPKSATTSTPSSTCTTPDPFTAIGGGVCVNGGWIPKTAVQ